MCLGLASAKELWAAETQGSMMQSAGAQQRTLRALQAMKQNRWDFAKAQVAAAQDRLAVKMYYWMAFQDRKHKESANFVRLAQFIRGNPDWPGIYRLRQQAERAMGDDLNASDVIGWFELYPPETATGMDRFLSALLTQGRDAEARRILAAWWAQTLMPREDQRMLYRKYGGYLTRDAHRRRLDRLMFAGQYTNAKAIAQVLGPGYAELTEARIALAEQKPGAEALLGKVPSSLLSDPGLIYERVRWRRRNDMTDEAIALLAHAPPAQQIQNPEEWWAEQHILIRRLLEKKRYVQAYKMAAGHFQQEGLAYAQAEWMAGWMALRFMNRPERALEHFEALYSKTETPISRSRGAYWAGRAMQVLGDQAAARAWYEKAAKYQTVFYGQLAGASLGQAAMIPNAAPPVLTEEDKQAIGARELVQAARLFYKAGMREEALQFLRAFVRNYKTPKHFRYAAEMAADLQEYADAIQIAKDATKEGMFLTAQAYPVIAKRMQGARLEWALLHALIRQESMFNPRAQSPVGAYGLMQLMPGTAREVSGKLGIKYTASMLANPDANIKLGEAYLASLLARYDGSYAAAIAAYNAGPSRVDKWIQTYGHPASRNVDLIDWIEMIPIYETRNYVQRVMENVYIYRLRLKGAQKPSEARIHIPSF